MLLVEAPQRAMQGAPAAPAAAAAVWVGCDDGRVLMYHPTTAQLLGSCRVHTGPVQAMARVGGQASRRGARSGRRKQRP
jgi:hypothetical protein